MPASTSRVRNLQKDCKNYLALAAFALVSIPDESLSVLCPDLRDLGNFRR
jgi:hypothetical protein